MKSVYNVEFLAIIPRVFHHLGHYNDPVLKYELLHFDELVSDIHVILKIQALKISDNNKNVQPIQSSP